MIESKSEMKIVVEMRMSRAISDDTFRLDIQDTASRKMIIEVTLDADALANLLSTRRASATAMVFPTDRVGKRLVAAMRQTIHHGDEGFASVESVPSGIVLRIDVDAPPDDAAPIATLHMTREQARRLALAILDATGGK